MQSTILKIILALPVVALGAMLLLNKQTSSSVQAQGGAVGESQPTSPTSPFGAAPSSVQTTVIDTPYLPPQLPRIQPPDLSH